jgi:DNA-binding transcriptional ArsR family regulator
MAAQPLRPTLWRTCRVLANRERLGLLQLLFRRPNLCVAEIARQGEMDAAMASQYLRALNARGLIEVSRSGRWVRYRPSKTSVDERFADLLRALGSIFKHDRDPAERIFRTVTAFTHPRRVEIWRAIQHGSFTAEQLRQKLRISLPALGRHLRKLRSRGFLSCTNGRWCAVPARDPLAKALTRLACMD